MRSFFQLFLVCCHARTYTYIARKDHDGDTLGEQMIPFVESALKEKCDSTPGCCGFNSYGYMKANCVPLIDMTMNPNFYTAVIPPVEQPKGLSGGSIFLIFFFCLLFVYCLGGAIYNTKTKGTTGVESIPNIQAWRNFPGYVKGGFSFTKSKLTGGKAGATPSSAYDSVA